MQAAELAAVASAVKAKGLNVIVFSGYTYEELLALSMEREVYTALLDNTDILVDGLFDINRRSMDLRFRGSANQRAIDVPASLRSGSVVLYPL